LFTTNEHFIFQLSQGEIMLLFLRWWWWWNTLSFVTNTLSWIYIVLGHWNNSLRLYILLHSHILSHPTSLYT